MNLSAWLQKIKSLHPKGIDLSLERTRQVAERLGVLKPVRPVVTVAGTNGKGSCVAGLEAIMIEAGYKVGAFTSPFLFHYNEQVRLQGKPVTDEILCNAFAQVMNACGPITLTQFEFGTLAAMVIFKEANLDLWILEVGMGGRWDAVNVIDADIAIVASIAIDHVDWLGNTRDAIAREKAGIFRPNKPVVYGDLQPPTSLIEYANTLKSPLFLQGQQFGFNDNGTAWDWWSEFVTFNSLPLPTLALQNMSSVLKAVELLQPLLPVKREAIDAALQKVRLPGRLQLVPGDVPEILDVSHNPAAVEFLAHYLQQNPCTGKTHAVFSMLVDKDIVSTLLTIQHLINSWHVAPLIGERSASEEVLAYCFRRNKIDNVTFYPSIKQAKAAACQQVQAGDQIVVFGSFHTVSEAQ